MGEPEFCDVDNPGKWSQFSYRPDFEGRSNGNYKYHSLPTGVTPVPADTENKRIINGWSFHYDGWTQPENVDEKRGGATRENLFPEERRSKLDATLLKRMGLTRARVQRCDALFFYQLVLPLCNPSRSGIEGDPRRPFYSAVEGFSNLYAYSIGLGS